MRIVLALTAALLCLAASGLAEASETFTFALNWFPVGDHAAYWVALDKGYFGQRGLEVALENSKGSGDSIAKVDTGRADAGLADSSVVMAAISHGAKIRIVGMIFDKSPLNFFSAKDMPITKPKDLEGHTIGAPAGDTQRQLWPAFAKANNVDQSKVTWVNIEPTAKVAALAQKRVDVVADFTTGLPLYEKPLGAGAVVMMPWSNFGYDMYSMAIIASEKTMTERPRVLKAFLEAAYMGWRDVIADPKAAMTIFKKRVPEIDAAAIQANMMMGLDLMRTQRYAEHGIGWIDEKEMCSTVDLVNTYMNPPRKVECKSVFTDAFLPKIALPVPAK